VLWGRYKSLASGALFDLATHLLPNATGQVQFFPAISQEQWRMGMAALPAPELSPEQVAGKKGGSVTQTRRKRQQAASG
jgi:hypothetical protein